MRALNEPYRVFHLEATGCGRDLPVMVLMVSADSGDPLSRHTCQGSIFGDFSKPDSIPALAERRLRRFGTKNALFRAVFHVTVLVRARESTR